ncbi:hypothetical protein HPP92_010647 [Vanilla planifolia]|uniref:NAD-dependent epimerase/dehydratase domain-containing protein n=1 Tax=Vanilla planifolia TaxID=51239 RepID=A0A835R0H2_VANPL|nr:hypothetical protein HPP92_010647 [Vanilla planifolia]
MATSFQSQCSYFLFPSPLPTPQNPFFHRRFLYRPLSFHASPRPSLLVPLASAAATPSAEAKKQRVLIVNADSGGHAVIGFYFARDLLGTGHEVTILTVGDEGSDKMKKPPFTRFSELVSDGGRTVWGEPADVGKVVGSDGFDVVLDNNGKDLDAVKPVADWAKSAGVKQFLFISSAGIYKTGDEFPHIEGDPVKDDAGHVAVERYIAELSFSSWATFRPQYIIGSGNNKDCEEWFFDRIVRGRPIPIPGSGMQLTNISHVRDLSSMLSLAIANPIASSNKNLQLCERPSCHLQRAGQALRTSRRSRSQGGSL